MEPLSTQPSGNIFTQLVQRQYGSPVFTNNFLDHRRNQVIDKIRKGNFSIERITFPQQTFIKKLKINGDLALAKMNGNMIALSNLKHNQIRWTFNPQITLNNKIYFAGDKIICAGVGRIDSSPVNTSKEILILDLFSGEKKHSIARADLLLNKIQVVGEKIFCLLHTGNIGIWDLEGKSLGEIASKLFLIIKPIFLCRGDFAVYFENGNIHLINTKTHDIRTFVLKYSPDCVLLLEEITKNNTESIEEMPVDQDDDIFGQLFGNYRPHDIDRIPNNTDKSNIPEISAISMDANRLILGFKTRGFTAQDIPVCCVIDLELGKMTKLVTASDLNPQCRFQYGDVEQIISKDNLIILSFFNTHIVALDIKKEKKYLIGEENDIVNSLKMDNGILLSIIYLDNNTIVKFWDIKNLKDCKLIGEYQFSRFSKMLFENGTIASVFENLLLNYDFKV